MTCEYRSRFAVHIQEMLKHRSVMGRPTKDYGKILASFDRFCVDRFPDEGVLSKEVAFAWCSDAKGSGKGSYNRASALRGLARHIVLSGGVSYIIPMQYFPMPRAGQPIIMSGVELANFFAESVFLDTAIAEWYFAEKCQNTLGCFRDLFHS